MVGTHLLLEEAELGAPIAAHLVLDVATETVGVDTVELADDLESVILGGSDHQPLFSLAVVGISEETGRLLHTSAH